MSFTNLYYKRTTGTSKACWICFKPTTTVLATINTTDFFYTCDVHLTDRGFASSVGESSDSAIGARKLGLGPDEIAKVKEEYEEKQKRKAEKAKAEKEKEKDKDSDKDKDKGKEKTGDSGDGKEGSKSPKSPVSSPAPPATHQRFTLHRDIFTMRLGEHRKRRQASQAKELAPRLPGAPRGDVI
ncbi:VPS4-associated protein 1 [Rhodocollybia butyracea]|uniref:VPS4-associated protein 1 n=1 Tax=Rhodocollybia butyracea TaxID=206335 RepID=A0A9P5UDS4_9AGAR|nr:VPS4-associated protein 1 [Rhodocollybia butyracea]